MDDHRHEPHDIYGSAATHSDIGQLEDTAAGLREDLTAAETRTGQLESTAGQAGRGPGERRDAHR